MDIQTEPDYTLHPEGAYHPDRFSLWFSDPRYPEITHLIPELFAVERKVKSRVEVVKIVARVLRLLSLSLAIVFVGVLVLGMG